MKRLANFLLIISVIITSCQKDTMTELIPKSSIQNDIEKIADNTENKTNAEFIRSFSGLDSRNPVGIGITLVSNFNPNGWISDPLFCDYESCNQNNLEVVRQSGKFFSNGDREVALILKDELDEDTNDYFFTRARIIKQENVNKPKILVKHYRTTDSLLFVNDAEGEYLSYENENIFYSETFLDHPNEDLRILVQMLTKFN